MLDNRLDPYFPRSFRWLGYMLIPLGIGGSFASQGVQGMIWPVIALVAGIVFIWTSYGSQIDFDQKRVREYIGLFGLKRGEWTRLPELDKIFITQANYTQVIWSRVSQTQERTMVYKAYLKGSPDFKFLFSEKRKKNAIVTEAESVANKFHLQVLDCTVNPPVWLNSTTTNEA